LDVIRRGENIPQDCNACFAWRSPKGPDLVTTPKSSTKNQRLFASNCAYALAWGLEVFVKVVAPLKKNKIARRLGIKTIMHFKSDVPVVYVGWMDSKVIRFCLEVV
jgi:hypothetical protein